MEVLLDSFWIAARGSVVLGAVVGVMFGLLIAVTPGLTGVMAVALILPFTFALDAVTSIAILLGVYVSAYYGGAVTAIMIATPGTPNAAATVLDGYPLCRQGYARKALQMSLYASVTGGTLGVLVAMSVFPLVAQLALRFGPPEMFALLVFSITVIAGVSGASLIKGFLAATAGFLLSSIGQDPIFGSSRFVFGVPDLMGGLHILPILIGLFSIPEIVMRAAESGRKGGAGATYIEMGPRLRFAEYFANWRIYLRSAAAGSILGALPGLGGSPAAFLGYFLAQRFSRHPERFGRGSMEGLSGCEAANSSVAGAAMVPMMSLGIPGGATTAVIMGALIIHGMTPGPTLFVTEPEFVYSTFLVLILCLMIMLVVGLGMIRVANLIVRIPTQILFPMVLIFATFGSYAIRNNVTDVIAMYLVGVLGCLMRIQAIPAAPLAIAFILGPFFEQNLRRSLIMSGGSLEIFARSGFAVTFLILAVVSAVTTVIAHRRLYGATRSALTTGK